MKPKLFYSLLLCGFLFALIVLPFHARSGSVVFDKKPIDCGAYFGTKCEGSGDGCDPKECEDSGRIKFSF
jgi:hypothetical protein